MKKIISLLFIFIFLFWGVKICYAPNMGGGTTSETDPFSLHLDQTSPQTIINGIPLLNSLRLAITHNGYERGVIKPCLYSLLRQNYPNFEIIVVDNLSTDNTGEKVQAWYRSYKRCNRNIVNLYVIKNDQNNVARAINIAIKKSGGKYLAIFGDDTEASPNALKGIIKVMETNAEIGVAMFRLMNYFQRNKIDSIGDTFDFYGNAKLIGHGKPYIKQYKNKKYKYLKIYKLSRFCIII